MEILSISRQPSTEIGTFGTLSWSGLEIGYTAELPWLDNKSRISCIPKGEYSIVRHNSDKYPNVVALVNHRLGVYHQFKSGAIRSAILIHSANYPRQLLGCIAPGTGFMRNQKLGIYGVSNSRIMLGKLRTLWLQCDYQFKVIIHS